MANAQRRKGLRGEAEVAGLFRDHGFDVRKLEDSGDLLVANYRVARRRTPVLHVEVKWENRLRLAWLSQAVTEAMPGTNPTVIWRPDRWPWCAMLRAEDLARLLA